MSVSAQKIAQLEALLYVSGEALERKKIKDLLEVDNEELTALIQALQQRYQDTSAGLMLIEHADAVEIATRPDQASLIEKFTRSFLQETLSKAALEVLAIIAYRGPVTRTAIESIRGVNCSFTLRNLLIRGLIDRRENPADNREYVYTTSLPFLEKLGIPSQEALPDFEILSKDARLESSVPARDQSDLNKDTTPVS